jgi:hypothetical protein
MEREEREVTRTVWVEAEVSRAHRGARCSKVPALCVRQAIFLTPRVLLLYRGSPLFYDKIRMKTVWLTADDSAEWQHSPCVPSGMG